MRVVRRAFELRPAPAPTLDPRGEYLTRAWRDSVYPLAERMGMQLRLPPVQPHSRLAHEMLHFAAAHGNPQPVHAEIFRAFFERGEDIGRIDVLVALGEKLGLDAAALRQSLETGEWEAEVVADEERAERLGVHAVPSYHIEGRRVISGVQSFETLRELLRSGEDR